MYCIQHCGEKSHPSQDCPSRGTLAELAYHRKRVKEDEALEELQLMEVDEDPHESDKAAARKLFDEFNQQLTALLT